MATKSASPAKASPAKASPAKKTKRKTAAPELDGSAVMEVLVSNGHDVNPDVRRRLVAAEAYFLAERRGFAAGNELQDWIAAEAVVDSRLQQLQVA